MKPFSEYAKNSDDEDCVIGLGLFKQITKILSEVKDQKLLRKVYYNQPYAVRQKVLQNYFFFGVLAEGMPEEHE